MSDDDATPEQVAEAADRMRRRRDRFKELNRRSKADLCAMYRELGYIGGLHPLEKWRKDEIIHGIIDSEMWGD